MNTDAGATPAQFSDNRTNRKPGLSLRRHTQVYTYLGRKRDDLVHLSMEIGNAYPPTMCGPGR